MFAKHVGRNVWVYVVYCHHSKKLHRKRKAPGGTPPAQKIKEEGSL